MSYLMSSYFILQSSAANPAMFNTIFLVLVLAIMYFFFMRPQIKKQKQQMQFVRDLKKGDEIVTTSGFIGKISKIEGATVQLQLDQKVFVTVLSSAVSKEMTESFNKNQESK